MNAPKTPPAPKHYPAPQGLPIVRCYYPVPPGEELKPRPAIVLAGRDPGDGKPLILTVCYGTSVIKRIPYAWDFIIKSDNVNEFLPSGLHETTRFDLTQTVELPYTSDNFALPRGVRVYGNNPQMGIVVESALPRLQSAIAAAKRK